jgi:hypothetical protein
MLPYAAQVRDWYLESFKGERRAAAAQPSASFTAVLGLAVRGMDEVGLHAWKKLSNSLL